MKLVYINPNATASMTEAVVAQARATLPGAEILGVTNTDGPPAIQGPEDGDRAVPGVLSHVAAARDADAIVIACFDDTGLDAARALAPCPVLGIGQAAYQMASLLGARFCVVTSLAVSIPVIRGNIEARGFAGQCAGVEASGLPVLTIDEGSEETRAHLTDSIRAAQQATGAQAVVLGCAGMAPLCADLQRRSGVTLIDGVAASAHLAQAAATFLAEARAEG